jgi:DNA primase
MVVEARRRWAGVDPGRFPDDEQLPLYNLPEIKSSAPDTLIVLVEGEKKVDAARVIFGDSAVVTTAAMGARSFLRTDARPLAGHPVLVFPDNDAAGQGYARTVTGALHKLGCVVRVVDVADLVGGTRGVTHDPDAALDAVRGG